MEEGFVYIVVFVVGWGLSVDSTLRVTAFLLPLPLEKLPKTA